jgi:outer membrane protein OmpA-like peptidoglycan-associated protein
MLNRVRVIAFTPLRVILRREAGRVRREALSTVRQTATQAHTPGRWPLRSGLASLVVVGAALSGPAPSWAAAGDLTVNGEVGGGSVLSGDQRDKLFYGSALQASLRPGLVVVDPLMVQLALSGWWFPSDHGYGQATFIGGGLRFEPLLANAGRLFIDGHAGLGRTGGLSRLMFDAGAGFEWSVTRSVGIGPALRYSQLHASAGDGTADAKFWSLALSVTLRPAPPPPPPPRAEPPPPPPPPAVVVPKDSDKDGVIDAEDKCPTEPAGAHPDPRPLFRGCPAADTDKDGVTDDVDKCPEITQGPFPDPERPGCPDEDDDHDGVYNREDQCRHEAAGLTPDPARRGCPAPDRDHDTIPDDSDACPDKPGAPNADPKKNGCPGLVLIDQGQIKINTPVFFATNKDTILKKSAPVLNAVGYALTHNTAIRKVVIEGHTDNKGKPEKNLDLSQRRADSVKAWLIQLGVEEGRLESKGFGDGRPLLPNTTAKGRAANRRVQFTITDPASSGGPATTP